MTHRWWYLRRGIAWQPVLACCAAAGMIALAVDRWPSSALVLLPTLVASCAAAAAFLFDEAATAVVGVTPRGSTWRRTARLAVAALPLLVWAGVVALRPGDLPWSRPGWWLVGTAVVMLSAGLAGLASRRDVPHPGTSLATGVTLAVLAPVVAIGLLGLDSPYPLAGFSDGVRSFWLVVAAAGGLACVAALRPGVRH